MAKKSSVIIKRYKLINDCFTGRDNHTYDLGRILWAISILAFLAFSFIDVYRTSLFAYKDFGIGLSTILGSGGLSLFLKRETEPHKHVRDD